jgi:hypothetical protein
MCFYPCHLENPRNPRITILEFKLKSLKKSGQVVKPRPGFPRFPRFARAGARASALARPG